MPKRYRRNCNTCGRLYYGVGKFFCSSACNRHTPETIEKIRLTNLGQKRSKEACINVGNATRGRRHSVLTKEKMRLSHLREKGSNWQGGITRINLSIRNSARCCMWRDKVFEKDDWKCQLCLEKGGYLHAHHLKSFSDIIKDENIKSLDDISPQSQLWDVENGSTMHIHCHKRLHGLINSVKKWKRENKLALM